MYDEDEVITVVGALTARELVLTGADFQIGKEPKVEAECALIVWYEAQADAQTLQVVEFSFRYTNNEEQYAYSTPKLPPIPREACHRFHGKPATDSTGSLPLIPYEGCH
jgi:hypothetical protein